jgi:hypothetical protein
MEGTVAKRRRNEGDAPDGKSGVVDLLAQVVRLLIRLIDDLSR